MDSKNGSDASSDTLAETPTSTLQREAPAKPERIDSKDASFKAPNTTIGDAAPIVPSVKDGDALEQDPEIANVKIEDVPALQSADHVNVPLSRAKFVAVFIALIMALFLSALDQTIVATAIVRISTDFDAFGQAPWISTAYMLTTTAFAPAYGKMADIFGRKPMFLFAVAVFEIGSLWCGVAQGMAFLIIGRAIAGVGAAGVVSMILIIVADIVSFRDRGKYQGIFGAVFGIASVIGPLLGGVFADGSGVLSWRWCFFINLPIGVVTLVVIFFVLHIPSPTGAFLAKCKRVDWFGITSLVTGIILLLLPVQMGGEEWEWSSAPVIITFILAFLVLGAFVYSQFKFAKEPIIPPAVFENRSVPAIVLLAFCLGSAMFSLIFYLSIYFQVVDGDTATQAGLKTIPLILSLSLMSLVGGQLMSRLGVYVPFFYIGGVILTVGCAMISTLNANSNNGQRIGYLIIAGTGVGAMIQGRIIGIQASVQPQRIAIATALVNFAQTLGGALGLGIVAAVYNNVVQSKLATYAPGVPYKEVQKNVQRIGEVYPADVAANIKQALTESLSVAFAVSAGFAGLIVVFAVFIKQYRRPPGAKAAPAAFAE